MLGEGASVRKDLYEQFKECYRDVAIVIASNKLPASEAQARDEAFNQDVWTPLTTRVEFIYMSKKHKGSEIFPYTKGQLAKALHYLQGNMYLVDQLQELDLTEVPVLNAQELLDWNRGLQQ